MMDFPQDIRRCSYILFVDFIFRQFFEWVFWRQCFFELQRFLARPGNSEVRRGGYLLERAWRWTVNGYLLERAWRWTVNGYLGKSMEVDCKRL